MKIYLHYLYSTIFLLSLTHAGFGAVYNVDKTFGNPAGPTIFDTIQNAIDNAAVVDGDSIRISGGTYNEEIVLTKRVDLIGQPGENVYLDGSLTTGTTAIQIQASGVAADNILIENINILNYTNAILFENGVPASIDYISLNEIDVSSSTYGINIPVTESVQELKITLSEFSNITDTAIHIPHATGSTEFVDGITVESSTFTKNTEYAIYMERGETILVNLCTFTECGKSGSYQGAISVHLRDGTYTNYDFTNNDFFDCGSTDAGAAALIVRARDDAAFAATPGFLDDLLIRANEFIDLHNGIQFGQIGTQNASPINVVIENNGFEPITGVDIDIDSQIDITRDIPVIWDIQSGANPLTTDYDAGDIATILPHMVEFDILKLDGVFNENITFTQSFSLIGSGQASTTLTAPSGAVIIANGNFDTRSHITTIEDLTIDNTGGAVSGFFLDGIFDNFALRNVTMEGFTDQAIEFGGHQFEDMRFESCTFSNNTVGWRMRDSCNFSNSLRVPHGSYNIVIDTCLFDNNGTGVLFANNSNTGPFIADSMLFDGCIFSNNGNFGIGNAVRIVATSDGISYVNNITFDSCTFTDNTSLDPTAIAHVYAISHGGPIDRIRYVNCSFSGPSAGGGETGIILDNATGGENTIDNPVVYNTSFDTMDTAVGVNNITDIVLDDGGSPLILGPGVAAGLNPRYELIALSGDQALPGTDNYQLFAYATINNDGDVAYISRTDNADPRIRTGIWSAIGNTFTNWARQNDNDVSGMYEYNFLQRYIKLSDTGEICFNSRSRSSNNGAYYSFGGVLGLSDASNSAAVKRTSNNVSFSNNGNIITRLGLNTSSKDDSAVGYYSSGNALQVVLQEASPLALLGTDEINRPTDDPIISVTSTGSELVYFPCTMRGGNVDRLNNLGLLLGDPSDPNSFDYVFREGIDIGTTIASTMQSARRGICSLNGNGEFVQLISLSRVSGLLSSINNELLITNIGGDVIPIIQESDPIPGTGGGALRRIKDVMINEYGVIVFVAQLVGVPRDRDMVVVKWTLGGGIEKVIQEGDLAPDRGAETIMTIKEVAINNAGAAGNLVLHAKINGTPSTNEALWLYNLDTLTGSIRVEKGEIFYINDYDRDLRSMRIFDSSSGNDGRPRMLNNNNQVVTQSNVSFRGSFRGIYIYDLDL